MADFVKNSLGAAVDPFQSVAQSYSNRGADSQVTDSLYGSVGGQTSLIGSWFGNGKTAKQIMNDSFSANQVQQQNAFNADESQKARDFEERMSSTAYQRQVADMQAAGINPALAMGGSVGSGATTPSGSAATGAAAASSSGDSETMDLSQALDFAMKIAFAGQQFKQNEVNIRKTEAEANERTAQSLLHGKLGEYYTQSTANARETFHEIKARVDNIRQNTDTQKAQCDKWASDIEVNKGKITEMTANVKYLNSQAAVNSVIEKLRNADLDWIDTMYRSQWDLNNSTRALQKAQAAKAYSDVSVNNQQIVNLRQEVNESFARMTKFLHEMNFIDSASKYQLESAAKTKRERKWLPIQYVTQDILGVANAVGGILNGIGSLNRY